MSTGAPRRALADNGCFSTVLTTRRPGISAIGILARLRRLSLGGVATSVFFSSLFSVTDGLRMANISLGLLLDILIYRLLAAGLGYPGLGTLAPRQNPDLQAIGS